MNLYLLRHGTAAPKGVGLYHSDSERPLTEEGFREMKMVAVGIHKLGISVSLLLTSTYVRAIQTAESVLKELDSKTPLTTSKFLTPDGNPKALIQEIQKKYLDEQDVMLVGHEPYLGLLASILSNGNFNAPVSFTTGTLCKLEIQQLKFGKCATFSWIMTPHEMAAIVSSDAAHSSSEQDDGQKV